MSFSGTAGYRTNRRRTAVANNEDDLTAARVSDRAFQSQIFSMDCKRSGDDSEA